MLQKQVVTVPIAKGLDTKTDEFQVEAGNALALENARFYKAGKLQKRYGFSEVPNTGAALSGINAIISDDEMINAMTDSGSYSYSEGRGRWELISNARETPKIKSEFIFKSGYDQFNPDMDICEELGVAAYIFREIKNYDLLTAETRIYVTVILEDLATKRRKTRRIEIAVADGAGDSEVVQQKVIVTAISGAPVVNIFYMASGYKITKQTLDENLNNSGAATVVATLGSLTVHQAKFDVCKDSANIFFAYQIDKSLNLYKYDLSGALVASLAHTTTLALYLGSSGTDYANGFSMAVTTNTVHVFWVALSPPSMVFVSGVGFTKSLVASIAENGEAYGDVKNISVTANGENLSMACFLPSTGSINKTFLVSVATTGGVYSFSSPADLLMVYRVSILSRPFIYNNQVYVFGKCPESDQNTGLLVNLTTGKFSALFSPISLSADRSSKGAQYSETASNAVIHNGVAYSLCEKIFAPDTTSGSYEFNASVSSCLVASSFISDHTCGTKVKIGDTNYFTNGTTFAFDNRTVFETGFFLFPKVVSVTAVANGAATAGVASKTFSYIAVYNYYNSRGELERSVPSFATSITTPSTTTYIEISVLPPAGSYKADYDASSGTQRFSPEIVVYRTTNGGSSYYRVTSADSSPNGGSATSLYDASEDSVISNNQILYTAGGTLESNPPPNAKFSTAGGNRLFLGGLEEEDEIAYSKKQLFGEMVSFSDFFRMRISSGTVSDRTKISALGYLDGKVIIFRENSVYYVAGDGPLETGAQDTFTNPEVISSDTGCVEPRSVLNIPNGLLFKSKKGIYLLDRSLQVNYVGAAVEGFNDEKIIAALVSDKFNEARFYTDTGNCIAFNYLFEAWSIFSGQTTVDANIWKAIPVQVLSSSVCSENEALFTDLGLVYPMKLKTPWLKLSGIQDFSRIWSVTILGKFKSSHTLRVRAYYDYGTDSYDEYTVSPLIADTQYQYRIHLKKQKCESVQFEIQDLTQVGESMELSALTLEVGLKKGSIKLPAARKY